eukprot:TRINITY_DN1692_c0_g1_i1.p1 TRINITY_DN1692_c0_g1~~TRINITY_DN1692_c0_g1_i1.p1  ORF type:complete len:649 (+),score=114.29 TRINITY_DN1692_c0_g1_i1:12-1958(+)
MSHPSLRLSLLPSQLLLLQLRQTRRRANHLHPSPPPQHPSLPSLLPPFSPPFPLHQPPPPFLTQLSPCHPVFRLPLNVTNTMQEEKKGEVEEIFVIPPLLIQLQLSLRMYILILIQHMINQLQPLHPHLPLPLPQSVSILPLWSYNRHTVLVFVVTVMTIAVVAEVISHLTHIEKICFLSTALYLLLLLLIHHNLLPLPLLLFLLILLILLHLLLLILLIPLHLLHLLHLLLLLILLIISLHLLLLLFLLILLPLLHISLLHLLLILPHSKKMKKKKNKSLTPTDRTNTTTTTKTTSKSNFNSPLTTTTTTTKIIGPRSIQTSSSCPVLPPSRTASTTRSFNTTASVSKMHSSTDLDTTVNSSSVYTPSPSYTSSAPYIPSYITPLKRNTITPPNNTNPSRHTKVNTLPSRSIHQKPTSTFSRTTTYSPPSSKSSTTSPVASVGAPGFKRHKLVFLGEQNVGKTSILTRFIYDAFDSTYQPTIGIDFISKTICTDNKTIHLQLWDTAGQERFRSLLPTYLRQCSIVVLVYDVTNAASFLSVDTWFNSLTNCIQDDNIIVVLCGNKTDLTDSRVVTVEEGRSKAQELGTIFIETSAKQGDNIKFMFRKIASVLPETSSNNIKLVEDTINLEEIKVSNNNKPEEAGQCMC